RHPPGAVEAGQSGLFRADLGASGAQEGSRLVTVVHPFQARRKPRGEGWAVSTPFSGIFFTEARSGWLNAASLSRRNNMAHKKVLLVTGASRGMGVDIAKAALTAGYAVVATGRDPQKVEN